MVGSNSSQQLPLPQLGGGGLPFGVGVGDRSLATGYRVATDPGQRGQRCHLPRLVTWDAHSNPPHDARHRSVPMFCGRAGINRSLQILFFGESIECRPLPVRTGDTSRSLWEVRAPSKRGVGHSVAGGAGTVLAR